MIAVSERGPRISVVDVRALEDEFGWPLPADYRAFLLDTNGGLPESDIVDVPGLPSSPTDVQVMFGINRAVESSCIPWNLGTFSGRLRPGMLPIARDSIDNLFCLSLQESRVGEVLYCDLAEVYGDLESEPAWYVVASNFSSFVSQLRSEI